MREQWRRMLRFERAECKRFDHVIAVSEQDATTFKDAYEVASVSHVGTGVDLEYFNPTDAPRNPRELVFVGSMDWMPNDDGIRWFVEKVFPRVREKFPDATLTVVGRTPSATLQQLAARTRGVEVTGTVADVRPYLARASISVVPLRVGGGTRLKIYEAMAMGIPVVSTTIGAEGLPVQNGTHLVLADDEERQIAALSELLAAPGRRQQLAAAALGYVRLNCGWDAIARQFVEACAGHDGESGSAAARRGVAA
jgi:glycosyltransferase involved in cell wall biosynthesis